MPITNIPERFAPMGDLSNRATQADLRVKTQANTTKEWLAYTVPAVLAGAIDDIGQSFGIIKDENAIQSMLRDALGNSMADFYSANKEGFKLAGSLSTSLIPILTIPKLLKTTSVVNKAIRAMPGGKSFSKLIATSGKSRHDQIMSVMEKAKVLRTEGAIDLAQDPVAVAAIRKMKLGALADSLRENLMIDAALYGMYNEQEFFFPATDSPMTNLALYGTFDAAFALGAYKFAGAAIVRALSDMDKFAKDASRMRNRTGIANTQVISVPNARGVSMTESAVKYNEGKLLLSNPEFSKGARSAANDRVSAAKENIAKQTKLAGLDTISANKKLDVSHAFKAEDGEMKTVEFAITQEPSLAPATLSMQPLIRGMDKTIPEEVDAVLLRVDKEIKSISAKIEHADVGASTFKKDSQEIMTNPFLSDKQITEHNARLVRLDELQAEKWKLENSLPMVWEVDGSVTPLQSRPFTSMDNPKAVDVVLSTDGIELSGDRAVKIGMHMGFTNDMSMVIKPAIPTSVLGNATKATKEFNLEEEVINGVRVARSLSPNEVKREMENAVSFNMIDMTFAYSQQGRIGANLYNDMASEFRTALFDWKGSSNSGAIRDWAINRPEKLIELQDIFKKVGLHKKLYEVADDNGMLPLYRGESVKSDITKVGSDVVSMTPNAAYADRAWGGGRGRATVRVNVHVEDIVGVIDKGAGASKYDAFGKPDIGAYGHEFEFIVKGNKSRISVADKRASLLKAPGRKETLDELIQPYVEQKRLDFQSMTLDQAADGWVLAQRAIKQFKPGVRQLPDGSVVGGVPMDMSKNFMEIDATLALMDKFPDEPIVHWLPEAGLPREQIYRELQFLSMSKKFTAYTKERNVQIGGSTGILKLGVSHELSTNSLMRKLNLPNDTGVGKHPLVQMFDAFNPGLGKEVPELRDFVKNMDDVENALERFIAEGRLVEGRQLAEDYGIQGISLRPDLLDDRAPVMVWQQNVSQNRLGAEQINDLIASKRMERFVQLSYAEDMGAGYVAAFMSGMQTEGKMFEQATSPQYLIEGMQLGEGFGTTATFNARGQAVIEATDQLMDRAGKQGLHYVAKTVFNDDAVKVFNRLATDVNSGSLHSLEMTMSEARNGWVAIKEPLRMGDGKFALQLDPKSKRNTELWAELTGRDFKTDVKAAGTTGLAMPVRMTMDAEKKLMPKPAVMDELAIQGHTEITRISHMYLDNENFIRGLKGLSPIPKKEWHTPFYNEVGAKVMYMVDNEGVVVNQFVGSTQNEALRLAEAELKQRTAKGELVAVQSEEYVKRHVKTAGHEFEARVNFGRAGVQTGSAKGKTGTIVGQLGVLENTLGQLQRNFTDLQQRTAGVVFESELNYLRGIYESMSHADQKRAEGTTIFQQLERAYLQTSSLNAESAIGKLYYGIEDSSDMLFAKLWDKYHTFIPQSTNPTMKEFVRLNESLGAEYNPFKTFDEFIQKTEKATRPPTLRSMGSGFNKIATNLVLRIFDLGMPLINIASVAGVAPAVVATLKPLKGEALLAWKRRNGLIGSPISDTMMVPSPGRMSITAVHGLFDPETRAALRIATKKYGLMKQEVAERIDLMTAPMEGYAKRNMRAIVDFMSMPTDKSEELSRALSFSMFYNIGRKSMRLEMEDAITFAHKQANNVVGDYRATNRPKIFQGATGMPLGLFTTWAWNFMQRIYGDLEGGRLGAVATQAFVHAFLFGGEAMPGYAPLINTLTTSYDGTRNLVDVVDDAWGTTATDMLMTGTLANAPKMFGLGDGIAIQNRAALGVPALFQGLSGGSLGDAIPAYRVMSTLTEGAGRIAESLMNIGANTPQEIAETMANFGVNGTIKTAAEMSLGQSTNRAGELINANLYQMPEMIARVFELKTLRENKLRQELSREKQREATKADHIRSLSRRIRTATRAGNLTNDFIQDSYERYDRAGGTGDNYRGYLRQQIINAQFSKDSRLLVEKIGTANDLAGVRRLIELRQDENGF